MIPGKFLDQIAKQMLCDLWLENTALIIKAQS